MRTLIICLAACSLVSAADIRAALQPKAVRQTAPDFVLLDASGKPISLSSGLSQLYRNHSDVCVVSRMCDAIGSC